MAKYIIHCCLNRANYVSKYLIPSMLEQGIKRNDIMLYVDALKRGNLRAFVSSCEQILRGDFGEEDGVWHIQDDVIICRDFKKRTEELDEGLVCGFTCKYDNTPKPGEYLLREEKMWFSFPCIRIPNDMIRHFITWTEPNLWRNPYFEGCVKRGKGDDFVFREFALHYYPSMVCKNVAPNLVDHIDYLLGGSVCNKWRKDLDIDNTRSLYFNDTDLVKELEEKLALDNELNI